MAASKRRRSTQEESDVDSDFEDGAPASSTRLSTSKRVRTSEDSPNDEDSYDWDAEEASTQRATLEIRKKMSQVTQNVPAEGGIILSVICENFMVCHKFLEIKFGPFMNFVIGHNGSGKSAILTAITLALGGKATSTNRGSAMRSFIKEGEDVARITVKIKNSGDGFKQDQYDDVIVVERNFNRDGSSGYKLKSKQGKIISSKKDELDEICDYFGLQVDNPMNVLTQDLARAFLSSSTNPEKYKFFAKGVQLEQLDQDYSLIKNGIDSTEAVLQTKIDDLSELKANMDRWEEKVEQLKSHTTLRDRVKGLQYQMAWIQVRDAEKQLESFKNGLEVSQNKVSRAEAERETASTTFEEANQSHEQLSQKIQEENETLIPLRDAKKAAKAELDNNKKDLQGLQTTERELKGTLTGANKKIKETTEEIRKEEERLKSADGGSNIELMEAQRNAEAEVLRIGAQIVAHDQQNRDDQATSQVAKQDFNEATRNVGEKKIEIDNKQKNLRQISTAEGDFIKGFNPRLPTLLNAISNEQAFRVKPVGPIGTFITLRDPKWWNILERFFGNSLTAFVVTNYDDSEILKRLMRTCSCELPLHITPTKTLNLIEPDHRFNTIYRTIEVADENVRRHLIIANSIEQVILIEDLNEANNVMERRGPNDHISACFSLNLKRAGWGMKVGGSNGAMGVTPVSAFDQRPRIRTDIGAQTRLISEEIQRLMHELDELKRVMQEKQRVFEELERSIQGYTRRKRDLELKLHRAEDKIEEFKSKIEEAAQDSKLNTLEARLKTYQETLRITEASYEELVISRDKLNLTADQLVTQVKSTSQDLALAEDQVVELQAELFKSDRRRTQCLTDKNHWYEQLEKYQGEATHIEQELANQQATVEDYTGKASHICPRIEVPDRDTGDILDTRLIKLHKELARAEATLGGTAEHIHQKSAEASQHYTDAKNQRRDFTKLLAIETRVYNERKRRWGLFQRFISARARAQFTWMMSERAFKGRLRLEHTRKPPELIIEVQPGQEETGNRGPKTLSGGEKSFSTICLLLSLWEAMGSPIRCLDEFDVFMDAINRNISVNMMIKAAERSVGKQFILITPQTMNNTNTSTQVKVIRMADPERNNGNQTRIDAQI